MALPGLIAEYFERTKKYSTCRLILEMALAPFPLKMALGLLYAAMGGEVTTSTTDALAKSGTPALIIGALLLAPLLETLIGQWLPIWLVSLFTKNTLRIVFLSALLFSLQHLHVGVPGVLTALPAGIFFSWCFLVGREQSRWRAYWTTTTVHAAHNACALLVYSMT